MSFLLTNPVLPGFSPDPSVVRVGEWYYLANSSFEWFPIIPIHRSKDLLNWEFVGSLQGPDVDFDFSGLQDSAAVWAPSLSHVDGMFWLTFSVIRSFGGHQKDLDTYVSRSSHVAGPWSRPARVTTTGFDPSIFHHEGRHWLVNMEWDHRPVGRGGFAGITLQELNTRGTATIGIPINIHRRAELIEGPNLYFRNGWFYLMLAEGGTGWNHGIAMMRSRNLTGPYEPDPQPALLTTRDSPESYLQKAGHGELVTSAAGEHFLFHLASRATLRGEDSFALLGRESCVQRVEWVATEEYDGEWLRLAQGGHHPASSLEGPTDIEPAPGTSLDCSLPTQGLPSWPWSSLRSTIDDSWADTSSRPGWVRLRGRRSTDALQEQSLLAQRITTLPVRAEVQMDASPTHYTHSAGLIVYYNTSSYFYLRCTDRETGHLGLLDGPHERVLEVYERDATNTLVCHAISAVPHGPLHLSSTITEFEVQFSWRDETGTPSLIGPALDFTHLSDDYSGKLRFTGPMVGICAQDMRDHRFNADFRDFSLTSIDQSQAPL